MTAASSAELDVAEPASAGAVPSDAGPAPAPAFRPAEFLRYLACSALALAVDTGVYFGLLKLMVPYATAAACGFACGLWVAYVLSVRFVFKTRRLRSERIEFVVFAAVGLFGLGLTEALLWFMIEISGTDALHAKLMTAGFVFASNFTLRKLILFTAHGNGART
jgi:putative flippase GtrA